MESIFLNFNSVNVLVVGDVMLDRYCYGIVNSVANDAPVPILNVKDIKDIPGGAANVAMNVNSLGAKVRLIGLIGDDEHGQILKRLLNDAKISYNFITLKSFSTITKFRILSQDQQLIRLDFESELNNNINNLIFDYVIKFLSCYDVLIISDYGKGTLVDIDIIVNAAKKKNIPVLIDPKGSDFIRYKGATVLTPNIIEFESVVGKCVDDAQIFTKGIKLLNDLDLYGLLITRSEHGMTLLRNGKNPLNFSSTADKVYDVTGAGDTVIAVLATSFASGYSLERSCYLSNLAAGIIVGKFRTSSINLLELLNNVMSGIDNNFNIVDINYLKYLVNLSRKQKEKIVMIYGVFNVLHVNHINFIIKASSIGDRLIVAVNNGYSINKLSNKDSLIQTLKDRMFLLSSLKYIDWIVSFKDNNLNFIIKEILPDFLIKYDNFSENEFIADEQILSYGIKILNFNIKQNIITNYSV
ncbi:bifunctional D-glycero-beta-D-manno-heptose-7-phosphate kinase/D-glycero-beta-D-manno-heptose 1-phosphate adenylyltransferase HldE [Candidatus Purcelliella pentastirinorum]|nr:bifunctional D-glycero-beta-D-manno-heptose-7-phosphate kinase/D-glycero-beta-D-manno-heptose 1-phosphate adenylyltransferase HldE [Candidatus Purcelliella pentastirinorum]